MHKILFGFSLFLIIGGIIFISIFAPLASKIRKENSGLYAGLIALFAVGIVFGLLMLRMSYICDRPITWSGFVGHSYHHHRNSRVIEN